MTRYELGFLRKLAQSAPPEPATIKDVLRSKEPGISNAEAQVNGIAGALFGGAVGAALDRKNRLRGILLGILGGGSVGALKGHFEDVHNHSRDRDLWNTDMYLGEIVDRLHDSKK
jgi:outer membrane receptor protein involved in Fe transport